MNDATIKFGYDGTDLRAGLRSDEQYLKRSAGQMEKSISRLGSHFSRFSAGINNHLGSIGGMAALVGIAHFTKSALEDFDEIAAGAQKLNTSAETFQRLGKAASILGNTDIGTLSTSLIRLRRQLIDEPTGEMAQGLEEIGFKAQDFLRLDADEQVLSLADAFKSAQEGGRSLPLLTKALGKNFSELIPLLANGREEMKKWMDEATVASEKVIAASDALNDAVDEVVKKQMTRLKEFASVAAISAAELLQGRDPGAKFAEIEQKGLEKAAERQKLRDAEATAAATAEARAMRERLALQTAELEKKRESIAMSKMDVDMLELQAKGQTRKLKKMEEASFIQKRAHEFSAQGLDATASIALAQREWNARENIEKRQKTGRSHIGGVGAKRMMGSGLAEFQRLQNTSNYSTQNSLIPGPYADDPRKVNVPQFSGSLSSRSSSSIKSRMMGGDSLGAQFGASSLTNRRSGTTANPQISAALSKGNDAAAKLDTTNELLKRGLLGG